MTAEKLSTDDNELSAFISECAPTILSEYRAALHRSQNPLSEDDIWEESAALAYGIITECARYPSAANNGTPHLASPPLRDINKPRVRHGIHPMYFLRAGRALTGLVLGTLEQAVAAGKAGATQILACATALENAVWDRVEDSSTRYDSRLLNEVRAVESACRRSLARDIHDRLGNHLSVALRQVETCVSLAAVAQQGLRTELALVQRTLDETMGSVRHMVTGLRQESKSGSLESAITAFSRSMELDESMVQVEVNGDESWASPDTLNELFLVIRECLRNSLLHAQAGKIAITVNIAPQEIHGHVEDDGLGFNVDHTRTVGRTNGLASMTERTGLLGGRLLIASIPGRGTRISFFVPNSRTAETSSRTNPVRVMLADDHALLRSAVGRVLDQTDAFTVVAETGDGAAIVEMAERHRPDVLLLDVEMPGSHAPSTIAQLRQHLPHLRVLVVSMHDDPRLIQEMLSAGAGGYVHKGVSNQSLVSAIQEAVAHPTHVTLAVPSQSLTAAPPADRAVTGSLSAREVELLVHVATGLTNGQIANRLGIMEGTVKRHLRNIFKKLDATSRIEAVNRATASGLLAPDSEPDRSFRGNSYSACGRGAVES